MYPAVLNDAVVDSSGEGFSLSTKAGGSGMDCDMQVWYEEYSDSVMIYMDFHNDVDWYRTIELRSDYSY